MEITPIIPPLADARPDNIHGTPVWIVDHCPLCDRQHTHGRPGGAADPGGHRVAHCRGDGNGSGYTLCAIPAPHPCPPSTLRGP